MRCRKVPPKHWHVRVACLQLLQLMDFRSKRWVLWTYLRTSRTCSVVLRGFTWLKVKPDTAFASCQCFDCVVRNQTLCWAFSRGRLDGPWSVKSLAFPRSLLRALRQVLGRREGSEADTLLVLLIREGWEHVGAPERALRGGSCFPRIPGSHCF